MQKFKGVFREGVRERNIGYSDYQMYRQCSLYFGVMNKTKTVKVGRGKNAIFTRCTYTYYCKWSCL